MSSASIEAARQSITPEKAVQHAVFAALGIASRNVHGLMLAPQVRLQSLPDMFHRSTMDKCHELSALTLAVLATGFTPLFTDMALLFSDHPTGGEDALKWRYDTYFVARGSDNRFYAGSPAVHEKSEMNAIGNVLVSDSLEGIMSQIQQERPHWRWPSARFVEQELSGSRPVITKEKGFQFKVIFWGHPQTGEDLGMGGTSQPRGERVMTKSYPQF